MREEIFHAAGARTETEQKVEELVRFVREAGRIPVQRDTLYNELRRWSVTSRIRHARHNACLSRRLKPSGRVGPELPARDREGP